MVVLTLGIGTAAAVAARSAYASRYASVFFPILVLLVAGGITRFVGRRVQLGVLSVLLALFLLGGYWNVTYQRTQGRVAAQAINAAAAPGDVVLFCPDQLGPAFSRSLRTDLLGEVYPTLAPPQRVDWVDYAQRNAAADPAAVAGQVADQAGSHRIFVVWEASYRTLEGQCEALIDALSARRGPATTIVTTDAGGPYYEPGSVTVFPPAP